MGSGERRARTGEGVLALDRACERSSARHAVAAVWLDGSVYFSTGPDERKAKNLTRNTQCVITTGCNDFGSGLDVVVEGRAVRVRDASMLQRLADAFATKYAGHFGFVVRDERFFHDQGGIADVNQIAPVKAFAYGRGTEYTATRFRF